MNVTLIDLAEQLGLSPSTVSRALADSRQISQATKERVRAAAAELGYVVNASARSMRQGANTVVGLILPNVIIESYSMIAQTLANLASQRGRQLILSLSENDPDREAALVRAMIEARPSGIVAALTGDLRPETINYLRRIFCVQFLRIHPELSGPGVTADGTAASRLAVNHLLELGHRRIGFIGLASPRHLADYRLAGYTAELSRRGIARDPALEWLGDATPEAGERAAADLLALADPPSAIFLSSPTMATGAARLLFTRGLTDPRKLSVVSHGSSVWFDFWPGGMTSVHLPELEMALTAAEMLLDGADGERGPARIVSIVPELIVRGSTAAI